jgi:hypothetical protein
LIVVRQYEHDENKFVVIEGNRRTAAIKEILSDRPINEEQIQQQQDLEEISVLEYSSVGDPHVDKMNIIILQGLRHVSGPRQWGAYQQANLIVKLRDDLGEEFDEIDRKIGLGPRITPRYYRTYKALTQMMNDEEFGRLSSTSMFSLFEEALKKPSIREWLGWSEEDYAFNNAERLRIFYELIAGDPETDTGSRIENPQQMRNFGDLLSAEHTLILNGFLNGMIPTVESAHTQAFPPDEIPLTSVLQQCFIALRDMGVEELRALDHDSLTFMNEIKSLIDRRLDDRQRLLINE